MIYCSSWTQVGQFQPAVQGHKKSHPNGLLTLPYRWLSWPYGWSFSIWVMYRNVILFFWPWSKIGHSILLTARQKFIFLSLRCFLRPKSLAPNSRIALSFSLQCECTRRDGRAAQIYWMRWTDGRACFECKLTTHALRQMRLWVFADFRHFRTIRYWPLFFTHPMSKDSSKRYLHYASFK